MTLCLLRPELGCLPVSILVGRGVPRSSNADLGELRDRRSRVMLDQPQDVPAPSSDGCLAPINPDSTAKIEAEQPSPRYQIVGAVGECCLERIGLYLG